MPSAYRSEYSISALMCRRWPVLIHTVSPGGRPAVSEGEVPSDDFGHPSL